jgi:catechol 1,2-dioxygenase
MERTADPRLREIMVALVRHLHDFAREVRLTEDEFRAAADVLARLGQQNTDIHNEVILMAGSLGFSSLVCLLNNGNKGTTETSQNLLGPFWRANSPRMENGASIVRSQTPGAALFMRGRVRDQQGRPVAGADVDIWHSSPVGFYDNQDPEQADMNLRGKFTTDTEGQFWFRSVKPKGYPVPTDGVVGELLAAQGRHPYRPAHVHAMIVKQGYKTLISQVYADDDPNLHSDVQFGVTQALVGRFERHDDPHPSVKDAGTPWYSLEHKYVMEPGESRIPRPPIK